MYQLAICEDDQILREHMYTLCHQILDEMGVKHALNAFASAEELEEAFANENKFDLLILDIMLGNKNGMELAKGLREKDNWVSIIFATSAEEYLREGYNVQPVNFLVKPVEKDKLKEALALDIKRNHSPKNITLKNGGKTVILALADIQYIEAGNHNVTVKLVNEEKEFKISLSEMERMLSGRTFCRCHNSYLVNMGHVYEITRTNVVLGDGTKVPIGRRYYQEAQHRFIQYLNTQ